MRPESSEAGAPMPCRPGPQTMHPRPAVYGRTAGVRVNDTPARGSAWAASSRSPAFRELRVGFQLPSPSFRSKSLVMTKIDKACYVQY